MRSLYRGGLLEISLVLTTFTLVLPQTEAFFFNLPGMSGCGGCFTMPPCCSMQQHHHHQQSSGFGSQLFSSYGVGRMFAPAAGAYATAPSTAAVYPIPPAPHPWAQHMLQHAAAAQQHWNNHQAQHPMASRPAIPPPEPVASQPNYGYQTSTPETTTSADEASFFSDNQLYENSSPPPSPFSEQIDEEPTMMYSTDQTREPLRENPSGYTYTASPSEPSSPAVAPVQVESASPVSEIATGYFRSKPPKVLPPVTQEISEFSETATWAPATTAVWAAPARADSRLPQLAFSADEVPVQQMQALPAAAPAVPLHHTALQPPPTTDWSSTEVKELDDLDMLLITSDESFRPVTSQNPARPLTSEERAGFKSNDISKIADGLPPSLSDVIFWPIGKDITLLKRAIALRRRRDEEARRRRSREGSDPSPQQKHRSEPQINRLPSTDERVSSFLVHYLRRRAPSGDSRRFASGGESERTEGRRLRSSRTAREILRSSILEKILAMEELLAEA